MKFVSYFRIIRPFNFFFVLVAVLFGAFWLADESQLLIPLLAAISGSLIAGGGYTINDFFDLEIDKINRPKRPIPNGMISPSAAKKFAFLLFILGIGISFFMRNRWMIILAVCNSMLLYIYAYKGKRMGLLGNLVVSFVTASAFLYGGLANNNLNNAFFVFSCALLFTLIRELIKDLEDIDGDRKSNAQTFPIAFGSQFTIGFAFLFWFFLTILTIWGFSAFYEISVFILLIIFVDIYLLINLLILSLKMTNRIVALSEKIMKIDMLVVLLLLWFGQP